MEKNKETSTLKQPPEGEINLASIMAAIQNLDSKFENLEKKFESKFENLEKKFDSKFENVETKMDNEFEKIRLDFVSVDARFDRLEAIALASKATALLAKSQMTIMTEEVRAWAKDVLHLKSLV